MKAKELKEILSKVDDDATVVLYNGFDEWDVFCTTAAQVSKENYCAYCRGDSFVFGEDIKEPMLVLAGWGASYEGLDEHKNENLHLISKGPEADESRQKAKELAEAQRKAEEARRAADAERLAAGRRKRFAVNYFEHGLREENFDTEDEAMAFVEGIPPRQYEISYVVYDRVAKKVLHRGKKEPQDGGRQ